jgi:hypothetical protein
MIFGGLQYVRLLRDFIVKEALPGTGVTAEQFAAGLTAQTPISAL